MNNPGFDFSSGDELSSAQEVTLKSIANLSLQNGDITYYNNGAFQRLGVGANGLFLTLSLGIPAWAASGISNTSIVQYATGTAYPLTNTAAALDFGTTDPGITINGAGTYAIFSSVKLDYNVATFAAVRTVTLKLRRTNNTAADISNSSVTFQTGIITLLTYTAGVVGLPTVVYTTTNTDDAISVWGSIDTVPSAGTIDAAAADIVAIRLT